MPEPVLGFIGTIVFGALYGLARWFTDIRPLRRRDRMTGRRHMGTS